MKFCFYLQRNFSVVGDALAVSLREKYGASQFCGYVETRWALEYLEKKSDVKWEELLLGEDVHAGYRRETLDPDYLRRLEADVGTPNLWPHIAVDRVLMSQQLLREYPFDAPLESHEDLMRIMQVTAKRISEFLDRQKPDVVVFSVIGSLSAMLLYHMARKRGIKTLLICHLLIEDRLVLSGRHDYYSPKEELGAEFMRPPSGDGMQKAKGFLNDFRNAPRPYYPLLNPDKQQISRRKQFRFLLPAGIMNTIRALLLAFKRIYFGGIKNDFSTVRPWNYVVDAMRRKLRNLYGLADLYDTPVEGEPFAFFPLQYEPEVTLLAQAPLMADQAWVARQIARSLPVGWKLYIKEHPQMSEFRPRSYYKALKKNPNVRIINPAVKSFSLIEASRLVVVITGTAGFEAILLKKPVVTLGGTFFNDLSFVKNCKNISELPYLVKEQTEKFKHDEKELLHFLSKLIDESASAQLNHAWFFEQDRNKRVSAVAPLADLIARKSELS
ncbi:MAG: hypothetical protein Q7S05_04290 [bacterium]|nr:hypothetical protein [bacterium]